jgi:hypothetical protein
MSAAESVQQKGIDGADLAKRWLESTTWIELPFDAYHNASICTLWRLDAEKKVYDLFGRRAANLDRTALAIGAAGMSARRAAGKNDRSDLDHVVGCAA